MKQNNLIRVFLLVCGMAFCHTGFAQSCNTQFAGTTFQPKTSISDTYYDISNIAYTDASSENIAIAADMTFNPTAPQLLSKGQYTISKTDGLTFHCTEDETYMLCSYNLSNLMTTSGKNIYEILITISVEKQTNCSTTREAHRDGVEIKYAYSGEYSYQSIDFGKSYTFDYVFTASASGATSFSINANYANGCALIHIKEIKVIGCFEQKIFSENGSKVCTGEENTFYCKGITADSYKWEISKDNKATWAELPSTEQNVTVNITDECYVRCTAGDTTLISDVCRPVVCCSHSLHRIPLLNIDFTSSLLTQNNTRVDFRSLDNPDSQEITSTYNYKSSGNVDEGKYIVTQHPKNGGYWDDSAIRDHTHELRGDTASLNDGFLLVNCGWDVDTMFELTIAGIQQNTYYDLSAFIANVDANTYAEHEPVNAGFYVYGMPGNAELLNTETGDLSYTGGWVEKGESFNSGEYKNIKLLIKNNHVSEKSLVVGNDIGIDDITLSICSPNIQIYTDFKHKTQDTTVCNKGKAVDLLLEANTDRDLSAFYTTPYYLFQYSTDLTNWTNVTDTASTNNTFGITASKSEPFTTGVYYRVWTGGDKSSVEASALAGHSVTSKTIISVSEPIFINYECPCTATDKPLITNYSACPVMDEPVYIKTLVTSTYDTLRIYDSQQGGVYLGENATFDPSVVGIKTYYVTNQKADDPATGDIYCESERVPVTIEVKDYTSVNIEDISTCFNENTKDSEITFTPDNQDYDYTWKGIEDATIDAVGKTYTLAKKNGSGRIEVTITDPTGTVCQSTDTVNYNLQRKYYINIEYNDYQLGYIVHKPYSCNEETLTAYGNGKNIFSHWDDGSVNAVREVIATSDTTFKAYFLPYQFIANGIKYQLTSSTEPYKVKVIAGDAAYSGNVKIPSIVEYAGFEFNVEGIGASAFENCTGLTAVTLPNSLVEIEQYAFAGCTGLTTCTVPNQVTNIGASAFSGCKNMKDVTIGEGIETIGDKAFDGCRKLWDVTCMAIYPPEAYESSFSSYGNLYIQCDKKIAYEKDAIFKEFEIHCIGAEEVEEPISGVTADPTETTVSMSWPSAEGASTYNITLTMGGRTFCSLVFNENGQLLSINFNYSGEKNAEVKAASSVSGGFRFTITGLTEGTEYSYIVSQKDSEGKLIQEFTGDFQTLGTLPTSASDIEAADATGTYKELRDGKVIIVTGDKAYDLSGVEVK